MNVQGPLDELAVFYCTPEKSGVYLTKSEIIALARAVDGSLRVNERPWMLADLLKSSASPAALAGTVDRLRVFAERSLADYERLAAAEPTAADALAPWRAKASATIARLSALAEELRL
jgi:hypothetical protein